MAFEIADDEDSTEKDSGADEEILRTAKARYKLCEEAYSDIRKEAREDLKFLTGDQWPDQIKMQREREMRPCLVENRLPQFVRQITNDQRQNPTGIKIDPYDTEANEETAKVLEGIIRHIEDVSNAEAAYDRAFEGAAGNGFGFWRVVTDYCDSNSFDQDIYIRAIRDPFSVYIDPHHQEPDGSDSKFAFVEDNLSADEYKNQFPESKLSLFKDWESLARTNEGWVGKDTCRVCEYFCIEYTTDTLLLLSDGTTMLKSKMPPVPPLGKDGVAVSIKDKREVSVPQVMWYKLNAVEVLEKTKWLGKWIPIIPVYGDEKIVDGKLILESAIRYARDPQRQLNYWKSAATEMIALAPKAPYIIAEGQLEGYEGYWETANTKNHAFLPYKQTDIAGKPAPPPQRNQFEPAINGIMQVMMQAEEALKATTGIYDPTIGNVSHDQSGIAIQRLNTQSQTSNYHLVDNLKRSVKHCGRILVDLLPMIYDTARATRVLQEDGTVDTVTVNKVFNKNGQDQMFNLSKGIYGVSVASGPSYATKRQEAVASQLDLVRSAPQIMGSVIDILVRNMDWPGSKEISDRLKKMLPPQLQDDPKDQPPLPPQVKAMIAHGQAMIQNLTQQLNAATDEINKKKFEIESKERIEMKKLEVASTIELANLQHKDGAILLQHQVGTIDRRLDMLNQNIPIVQEGAGGQPVAPTQNQQQPTGAQPLG